MSRAHDNWVAAAETDYARLAGGTMGAALYAGPRQPGPDEILCTNQACPREGSYHRPGGPGFCTCDNTATFA